MNGFLGRVMMASIFVLSGYSQLEELQAGNTHTVAYIKPKLAEFQALAGPHVPPQVWEAMPAPVMDVLSNQDELAKNLVIASVVLHLGGALLFLLGSKLGANMLMLLLLGVTPIMHNFWAASDSTVKATEMIMFLKNVAIFGGLMMFTSTPGTIKVKKD